MEKSILKNILNQKESEDIFQFLTETLSNSELNSLLLAVFHKRTELAKPKDLLKAYCQNRFVQPASINQLAFREFELKLLKFIAENNFKIFGASPLSPIGTSSILAPVHQDKVISASRGTEVVSDITNVMALEIAKRKTQNKQLRNINLASVHRHVRGQVFDFPGLTPHFSVLGLASAGRDTGNYSFEIGSMSQHLNLYFKLLTQTLGINPDYLKIQFTIFTKNNAVYLSQMYHRILENLSLKKCELKETPQAEFEYYQTIRFKLLLKKEEDWLDIGDGGIVDWTKQLLQNRKERLLISGLGTEFLFKIVNSIVEGSK